MGKYQRNVDKNFMKNNLGNKNSSILQKFNGFSRSFVVIYHLKE